MPNGEAKFRLGHHVEGRGRGDYELRLPVAIHVGGGQVVNEFQGYPDAMVKSIRASLEAATKGRVEHRTTVAPSDVNTV